MKTQKKVTCMFKVSFKFSGMFSPSIFYGICSVMILVVEWLPLCSMLVSCQFLEVHVIFH